MTRQGVFDRNGERLGYVEGDRLYDVEGIQTGLLREIRVPALCVVGAEDALTPPADAQRMAAAIPGAKLVTLPACGHLPSFEAPAALAAALRQWLAARP